MRMMRLFPAVFGGWLIALACGAPAGAQIDILGGKLVDLDGKPVGKQKEDHPVSVQAEIVPASGNKPAQLSITAKIQPGWHIYSLTQKSGGPVKSEIDLKKSTDYRLLGKFEPVVPPVKHAEPAFNNLEVETHEKEVTWRAPVELAAGIKPEKLSVAGDVTVQVCSDKNCLPPKKLPFSIGEPKKPANGGREDKNAKPESGKSSWLAPRSHVILAGRIESGSHPRLLLSATPAPDWHIYAAADRDPNIVSKPTLISLTVPKGFRFGRPTASVAPQQPAGLDDGTLPYHAAPVTWTIPIEAPVDATAGTYPVSGIIGYQTCRHGACDPPIAARFTGELNLSSPEASAPLQFSAAKYGEAATEASADTVEKLANAASANVKTGPVLDESRFVLADDPSAGLSTWAVIGFALVGGAILNLMPCVLPVIGLKILAFVEQSHQDRRQIFLLNLWYTLGLMSVFMVLATLAVTLNLGWGQQFSSTGFNIVMAGIVFVMALSFLGVWEIPIPGFVGAGKATELAAREGFSGAFSKGILTTVLATPCSGPFLGPVFGFTLKQPPYMIYAIFACIGLGMASPYLLIGLFPRLIRLLPKPGAWMDTFKQIMGFVLLGTVVYLLTLVKSDYVIPTLAFLFGLWAACWWIGRTPLYADLNKRLLAWGQAAAWAALAGWVSFTLLMPHAALLPWKPYSRLELARLASEKRTVLVDFTAVWCPNCHWNLRRAIDTEDVLEAVKDGGVVPLIADWSDGSEEVTAMLNALKSDTIPVLAIFPASRPNEPIILRDLVSQRQVLKAIREAGPSVDASPPTTSVSLDGR